MVRDDFTESEIWRESPFAKRTKKPIPAQAEITYTISGDHFVSLPLEVILTISRCLDTSILSSLLLPCRSLHIFLKSVLNRRKASVELITAVIQSNTDDVIGLLVAGADPDARKTGCPILHMAVRSHMDNSTDLVRCLLESGCDHTTSNQNGYTILYLAVLSVNINITKIGWLLKYTDPNTTNTELFWTPLHYAMYRQNKTLVVFLYKNVANHNEQDATGSTPLHIAWRCCFSGHRLRALLCLFGADQEAKDFLGLKPRSYGFLRNCNTFRDIVVKDGRDVIDRVARKFAFGR